MSNDEDPQYKFQFSAEPENNVTVAKPLQNVFFEFLQKAITFAQDLLQSLKSLFFIAVDFAWKVYQQYGFKFVIVFAIIFLLLARYVYRALF